MSSVLCHLGDPRKGKPETLQEYGKLREKLIQQPWACMSETEFLHKVTVQGCPFYQALMNGRDLMEHQFEKLCWRMQTFIGLDFDACPIPAKQMIRFFRNGGLEPWATYHSFSNGSQANKESYRLLWRVETDLSVNYDQCSHALKRMREMTGGWADKHALNPTRLWQGTNSGPVQYNSEAPRLDIRSLLT